MNTYNPSEYEESLASAIVDCAYQVHKKMGPGLLEPIYETCFCHELGKRGIPFETQVRIPLVYDGVKLDLGVRLDVFVDRRIICELKAVEVMKPLFMAQLLSQLRLVDCHLGFLINFDVSFVKEGIKRVIR